MSAFIRDKRQEAAKTLTSTRDPPICPINPNKRYVQPSRLCTYALLIREVILRENIVHGLERAIGLFAVRLH